MKIQRNVLCFKVLIDKEDGEFTAHALEPDIIAYGSTEEEAWKELIEALDCQISFAIQREDPGLLDSPAPQEFFDKWNESHGALLEYTLASVAQDEPKRTSAPFPAARYVGYTDDQLETMRHNRMELCSA